MKYFRLNSSGCVLSNSMCQCSPDDFEFSSIIPSHSVDLATADQVITPMLRAEDYCDLLYIED